MPTKAPTNPRETFEAFRAYEPGAGVEGLIRDWDLAEVGSHQIYYAVHGRLPEAGRTRKIADYNPAVQFANALRSSEFQSKIVKSLLLAYPEKRRMVFVHIPKCAGSHLTSKLVAKFPTVNFRWMDNNWIKAPELFKALRQLTERLAASDVILPHGHLPLRWYLNQGLIRFGDLPFAVVREPAKIVMSQVNYILTRFARDPELKALDTQDWARVFDKSKLADRIADRDFRGLAREILFSKQLVPQDNMCQFLGTGTAQSAFEMCASGAVELTDMDNYAQWLRARLGVEAGEPLNVSTRFVELAELGAEARKRVEEITQQDAILYERVRRVLSQPDRFSVSGPELL